jgi:CheY-like chemotaxis protein
MPLMGGKECLQKIKADPRLQHIPVTVFSTSSVAAEVNEFKRLGADFVVKPTTFHALVSTLTGIFPTRSNL